MFSTAVKTFSHRPCLSFMGRKYTYAETGDMVDRFAKGLQGMGIGKGARVGLCLPNTPFYVVAYHGILKAGATVVNFNPLYAEKEIAHQIKDSGVEAMVTLNVRQIQPKIEKMLDTTQLKTIIVCNLLEALPPAQGFALRVLDAVKGLLGSGDIVHGEEDARHVFFSSLLNNDGRFSPVDIAIDDVAVLQYTGGTTGVPKAAMLTHANLTANVAQAKAWFSSGNGESDRVKMLAVLPFFHVFCMTVQMNMSLDSGMELVMLPKFELKSLLSTIDRERPQIFAGVPTLYKAIADFSRVRRYDLSSLKLCVSGGAPLPDTIKKAWKDLTGLDLVEGYGLSETSPLASANPIHGVKKAGSIGLPMPATEFRIVDLKHPAADTSLTARGEICIRGPQVMKGYWNQPEETAQTIDADGFLHTGDVGYIDEDGYIFIVDRIKDMIIASGFKVFPRKVEDAILQHPAVAETMVAGVPDEYRGETVKAWVVLKEGQFVDAEGMKVFLDDKLAAYEMPKIIEFRQSLPKTLIGKPDRKALLASEPPKRSV